MTNFQLYLAWLRTEAPDVYLAAMRKITGQVRTLGGLDSDLVDSMTQPATMGSFGQDSSSDTSLPEITVYGDTGTADSGYTLPTLTEYDLNPPQITPTLTDVTLPDVTEPNITITPAPAPAAPATGGTNWAAAFVTAVGNVASAALRSSSQSNLVKYNTQRAQMGLPPVNAQGQVVSSAGLAPATSAIYALESKIAGVTGGMSPVVLLAGIGLLAFLFLRKR